jgi:hypothetical protein
MQTNDRRTATERLRQIVDHAILHPNEQEEWSLAKALEEFRASKRTRSRERQAKIRRVLCRRMVLFLGTRYNIMDESTAKQLDVNVRPQSKEEDERDRKIFNIAERIPITKPTQMDFNAYICTLTGSVSTRDDNRSLVKEFWF